MQQKRTKHKRKFRLLLDVAFAKPSQFQRLLKKANIAHSVIDCKLSTQASDEEIYNLAVREKRVVVTINFKDFKKLVKSNHPGIIAVSSELSNDQIDDVLSRFVAEHKPEELIGKAIKI